MCSTLIFSRCLGWIPCNVEVKDGHSPGMNFPIIWYRSSPGIMVVLHFSSLYMTHCIQSIIITCFSLHMGFWCLFTYENDQIITILHKKSQHPNIYHPDWLKPNERWVGGSVSVTRRDHSFIPMGMTNPLWDGITRSGHCPGCRWYRCFTGNLVWFKAACGCRSMWTQTNTTHIYWYRAGLPVPSRMQQAAVLYGGSHGCKILKNSPSHTYYSWGGGAA